MLKRCIIQHKDITQESNSSILEYYLGFSGKKHRNERMMVNGVLTAKGRHTKQKVVTKHIKIYFMKLYEAIWESF